MKKIKILLEYQCYPMWIYNEKGELIDNGLVNEFKLTMKLIKCS